MANGFCISTPSPFVKNNGTNASIVVIEVITIGLKRLSPATLTESAGVIPDFLNELIVSSFMIESFIIMPHITIIPVADIIFQLSPNSLSSGQGNGTILLRKVK